MWELKKDKKDNYYVSCPVPEGWTSEIHADVECAIPPKGYVQNPFGEGLLYIGIDKKNKEEGDNFWKRQGLPKDYDKKRRQEERLQEKDPSYIDPELEEFRHLAWVKRLSGCWFWNKNEAVYITGTHYLYLEWCYIAADGNSGYPLFWDSDRKFFLFLRHCELNPNCYGALLVCMRRAGKTQKSAAFLLDGVTKKDFANGGVQSKTADDAKKTVFKESIIRAFQRLPHFFKPVHDYKRVSSISNNLEFKPARNAEGHEMLANDNYLGGVIDWRSSVEVAYDGWKLFRYIGDEVFKTSSEVDIRERWNVVRYCLVNNSEIYGKAIMTSTVEEIEGAIEHYIEFFKDSNQLNLDEVGRTKTGLFRFFVPADEARNRDKYGYCDILKNRERILLERKSLLGNLKEYNSALRKEPLTIEEAFRSTAKDGLFDSIALADQIDAISWTASPLLERGNIVWEEEMVSTKWIPNEKGRWQRVINYAHPESAMTVVSGSGNMELLGDALYCSGIDPFSHGTTEANKSSNAAAYIFRKFDPLDPDNTNLPVLEYVYRHSDIDMFYDDMLKMLFHYGCKGLLENQKIGMVKYFEEKEALSLLIKIPGNKNYGIAAHQNTTKAFCDLIDRYITYNVSKIYFRNLLTSLSKFDISRTQLYDETMAFGYTILADSRILFKAKKNTSIKLMDVSDLF